MDERAPICDVPDDQEKATARRDQARQSRTGDDAA
jgi:hypothetical protein